MRRYICILLALALTLGLGARPKKARQLFPDGTPVEPWFGQTRPSARAAFGIPVVLTAHGVEADSTRVQTRAIQKVIDLAADSAAQSGKAYVVVVPRGVFLTGALQMRQGVNIYLESGARLKGSDDIADFPVVPTRIEGQSCPYFSALINADGLDGLKIGGEGTIDGNGLRYWKAFWLRRSWNPQCTNKDEQRPRLVYLQHCRNVELSGLWLKDSPFWTTHLYKCEYVRLLGLRITSPASPVKAPSTDAIDLDVCRNVLVSRCYMEVNDDAIALKGGKGPWADRQEDNGGNERIIIEDCEYGFCHGCLTCGSESVHNRNIILRRIRVDHGARLLWLKMRPDTPQTYEHILVEGITGHVDNFLFVKPWTQFFDLQGRTDMPVSYGRNITMRDCRMTCRTFFNVERSNQYELEDFVFDRLHIQADNQTLDTTQVHRLTLHDVHVEPLRQSTVGTER